MIDPEAVVTALLSASTSSTVRSERDVDLIDQLPLTIIHCRTPQAVHNALPLEAITVLLDVSTLAAGRDAAYDLAWQTAQAIDGAAGYASPYGAISSASDPRLPERATPDIPAGGIHQFVQTWTVVIVSA